MTRYYLTILFALALIMPRVAQASGPKGSSQLQSSPTGFVENKGQLVNQHQEPNSEVKYLLSTSGINIQLREGGFSYDTYLDVSNSDSLTNREFHRVDVSFLGANGDITMLPTGKSTEYSNYYGSHLPEAGVTHIHHYQKVVYANVYNNIDVEFYMTNNTEKPFEYNFVIHPGGNPADIKMHYQGANICLTDGKLQFALKQGIMEEVIPASWYETPNGKHPINAQYAQIGENTFGFVLAETNTMLSAYALVIDPAPVRHWGTYYGGTSSENIYSVVTDATGMIFVTGESSSVGGIATSGAHQETYPAASSAFLAKFTSSGTRVWGTYYGDASGATSGEGIALDNAGMVYIGGNTQASGLGTTGAHQASIGGGRDAFLAKFNTNGVRQWATYYGGTNTDYGYAVATDDNNNVFLAGWSQSTSGIGTPGAHLSASNTRNAFVVKFNSSGTRQWGTYYGGTTSIPNGDEGYALATDSDNNIYLTGSTINSTGIATPGAHQPTRASSNTNRDAFLVKFNTNGVRQWGTYYGGTAGSTVGWSVATDTFNNVYLGGITSANNAIATPSAHQPTYGGGDNDAFLVKFNPSGVRQWGTYYGGTESERDGTGTPHVAIATDNIGKVVYLAGRTSSTNGIATVGAHQEILVGNRDAFLAQIKTSNGSREWGTYFGGTGTENSYGATVDVFGRIYLVGATNSNNGIVTAGTHQVTPASVSNEGFIAQFGTITADAGADTSICLGESTVLGGSPTAYGSDAPFTYLWSPATGLNDATAAHPVATPTQSTTYIVVASNVQGVTDIDTVVVTILALPIANAGRDTTICQGESALLLGSGSGTAAIVSYSWSPAASLNQSNIAMPLATPNATTTYTLTVTDANGCQHSDNATITVIPAPLAPTLSPNAQYCAGDAIANLTATGAGGTITWYSNAALSTQVGSGSTLMPSSSIGTQTYYVTETNGNCVSPAATVTVTIRPLPIANAGNDDDVCELGSITLNGSGGISYLWSPAASLSQANIANPTATPIANTTYTLTVTDANGCTATDIVEITVLQLPFANVMPASPICQGASTTLDGSGSGVSFSWLPTTGLSQTNIAGPVATPAATITYTLTVTGANGCENTADVTVDVIPLPAAPTVGPNVQYCVGDVVANLTATGTGSNLAWYSNAALSNQVGTGTSYLPSGNLGTETFYVAETVNGCEGPAASVSVTMTAYPTANAGLDDSICQNTSILLNASGGTNYSWSPAAGLSQTDVASPLATPMVSTSYIVTVSTNGCADTDTVVIYVNPAPASPSITANATYCSGDNIADLEAVGTDIIWYNDANLTSVAGTGTSFSPTTTVGTHTYYATQSVNSCESLADTVTVTVNPLPDATFTFNDQGLEVSFTPNANGLTSYSWDFGDGNDSGLENPTHTYAAEGTYTVTLTTVSADGCTDASTTSIVVLAIGINRISEAFSQVQIFPNPTENVVTINFGNTFNKIGLVVMDIYGKTVMVEQYVQTNGQVLDVSNLASAAYFVILTDDKGQSASFKLIKY